MLTSWIPASKNFRNKRMSIVKFMKFFHKQVCFTNQHCYWNDILPDESATPDENYKNYLQSRCHQSNWIISREWWVNRVKMIMKFWNGIIDIHIPEFSMRNSNELFVFESTKNTYCYYKFNQRICFSYWMMQFNKKYHQPVLIQYHMQSCLKNMNDFH